MRPTSEPAEPGGIAVRIGGLQQQFGQDGGGIGQCLAGLQAGGDRRGRDGDQDAAIARLRPDGGGA